MKKIAYTQPEAEMVLLCEDDVIRTSLTKEADAVLNDLPSTPWIS